MLLSRWLVALLLVGCAGESGASCRCYPVIDSLHLGPDNCPESCEPACEDDCTPCGRVQCRFCQAHGYRYWCPECGYCPLYDDTDNIDDTDRPTTWPGKHETSWMRELDR